MHIKPPQLETRHQKRGCGGKLRDKAADVDGKTEERDRHQASMFGTVSIMPSWVFSTALPASGGG